MYIHLTTTTMTTTANLENTNIHQKWCDWHVLFAFAWFMPLVFWSGHTIIFGEQIEKSFWNCDVALRALALKFVLEARHSEQTRREPEALEARWWEANGDHPSQRWRIARRLRSNRGIWQRKEDRGWWLDRVFYPERLQVSSFGQHPPIQAERNNHGSRHPDQYCSDPSTWPATLEQLVGKERGGKAQAKVGALGFRSKGQTVHLDTDHVGLLGFDVCGMQGVYEMVSANQLRRRHCKAVRALNVSPQDEQRHLR